MSDQDQAEPSEFHQACVQMVYQYINATGGDVERLAVMAKAQVVAGYTMRRLLQQSHLLNKPLFDFPRGDVDQLVMQADMLDQERGKEDGLDQAMAGTEVIDG